MYFRYFVHVRGMKVLFFIGTFKTDDELLSNKATRNQYNILAFMSDYDQIFII